MTDQKDKRESQTGAATGNPRQERLKRALRENLKRRKTQARGRGDLTQPSAKSLSSNGNEPSPYLGDDNKPDE